MWQSFKSGRPVESQRSGLCRFRNNSQDERPRRDFQLKSSKTRMGLGQTFGLIQSSSSICNVVTDKLSRYFEKVSNNQMAAAPQNPTRKKCPCLPQTLTVKAWCNNTLQAPLLSVSALLYQSIQPCSLSLSLASCIVLLC